MGVLKEEQKRREFCGDSNRSVPHGQPQGRPGYRPDTKTLAYKNSKIKEKAHLHEPPRYEREHGQELECT